MDSVANRIDLRHMRYFVAIAREGSFRAAAEVLHISQPPLTRQIQQLEEILATPLLIRKSNGVEMTEAGKAFYIEAQNILALVERAAKNTRRIGTGQMGRLDVGVFGSAVFGVIPQIVLHFRNRYPDVEVNLHNMDRDSQVKALQERRIQVGFNRFFLDYPDLVSKPVTHDPLVVASQTTHRFATMPAVAFSDLENEPLIFYPRTSRPGGFSNYLMRQFHTIGIEPKIVQNVDDVVTAVAFVSSGLGLTICVGSSQSLRLPGVVYTPLTGASDHAFDLNVIYRASEQSPLLDAFLVSVKEAASLNSCE
ncbi:MAG: LysR substrate-binding domain-containing protein [Novosphingobium sp.]